jgi:hypothetical protein
VALVHERTISTKRPPLVNEVIAKFFGYRSVLCSARRIPYGRNLGYRQKYELINSFELYIMLILTASLDYKLKKKVNPAN